MARVIQKFSKTGFTQNRPRKGRSKKLCPCAVRQVQKLASKNRCMSAASIALEVARVLTRTRKYDHISPVLSTLHWLPTKHRIDFKILLITYKALNGLAPQYLSELLSHYSPSRPLRSHDL